MTDRTLILGKLGLVRRSLQVAIQHLDLLHGAAKDDDVDGIVRGREGFGNAMDLVRELMEEIDAEMPDWRPQPHRAGPDGYSSIDPSAHLGATE